MNKDLHNINRKLNAIQLGLLRYKTKKGNITLHVMAKAVDDNMLICAVTGNGHSDLKRLVNKRVNLVQKSENDYLYISGQVAQREAPNKRTLYIHILKACWFVRRSKGSLSWLQEKHIYDTTVSEDDLELAS